MPPASPELRTIELLDGERWWGGRVADGYAMPFAAGADVNLDFHHDSQAAPLFVSTHGRVLWSGESFRLRLTNRGIEVEGPVQVEQPGTTLQDAVRWAAKNVHAAPPAMPAVQMFAPQWALWIELLYEPTQRKTLDYAAAVLANGYEPGVIIIDDNWSEDYGVWRFRSDRFPDPAAMVRQLRDDGFTVMLWVCPYVSPDGRHYLDLRDEGLLLSDASGEPVIRRWWNGHSAVLDLTNPATVAWFRTTLESLRRDFGIDGFKFDGGDIDMYRDDDATFAPSSPADQVHRYGAFAASFPFNELRSGWRLGGLGAATRLSDANHKWNETGIGKLIGNQLTQGLLGMPFSAPDMIGGGQYLDFDEDRLDPELFVRHAQVAAFSPMMQFSAAPWRVLDTEHAAAVKAAADLRRRFHETIVELAVEHVTSGDPIVRPLEYDFPHAGLEEVTDAFMLGPNILVAPIITKGARRRSVFLPSGTWRTPKGVAIEGGRSIEVEAPLDVVPYFERQRAVRQA